jgi:hypothetical protein
MLLVHHGDHLRVELNDLLFQEVQVSPRGQGNDLKAGAVAPHHIQGAGSDGAGGSENREFSHGSRKSL